MNKGLIVSCQALPDEPLHSSFIMGKMAKAAFVGGAVGIRANGVEDIEEIKKNVNLPIIGIIKKEYPNLVPYITPTEKEVLELVEVGVDVIAVDATINQDEDFLRSLKTKWKSQKFMADISTAEEGLRADKFGFDYIGLTLVGYTSQSKGMDKFEILEELVEKCHKPIIAEGNFSTPDLAKRAMEMGAYAVVVGGAITRPQLITKTFADAVNSAK
ncbi:MAG: N-acetylmannosamine-6-phosphate 2-epimerase [Oscillospiraceae bacterium]